MSEAIEPKSITGGDFTINLPEPTTPIKRPKPTETPEKEPEQSTGEPAPEDEKKSVMLDDHGTPFDPDKHNPVKHPASGAWMPKGGRKKKAGNRPAPESEPGKPTGEPAPKPDDFSYVAAPAMPERGESESSGPGIRLDSKVTAKTATALLHVVSLRIFGASDGRFTADEVAMLNEAAEHVLEKRQIEMSPEWALVAAVGTVFGQRLTTPKGLTIVEKWRNRFVEWWQTRQARRAGRYVNKTQRQADKQREESTDGKND